MARRTVANAETMKDMMEQLPHVKVRRPGRRGHMT